MPSTKLEGSGRVHEQENPTPETQLRKAGMSVNTMQREAEKTDAQHTEPVLVADSGYVPAGKAVTAAASPKVNKMAEGRQSNET